jgi:hypothetical protein
LLNLCIQLHLQPCDPQPLNPTKSIQFNIFPPLAPLAGKLHSPHCLPDVVWPGCNLTTSFEITAVPAVAVPKKKYTLLPILTVLFIVSYGLMTMLIVEQSNAIQSQSNLIKVLLPDSRELWVLKGKAITDNQAAKAKKGHGSDPSAPSNRMQTLPPATQAQPHSRNQVDKTAKPDRQFPAVPASDLIEQRRALHTT